MRMLLTALLLLTTPAAAFDVSAMSPEERSAFRAEIRSYLLENPEVLMEAIAVLEQRREAEAAQGDAQLLSKYEAEIFNDSVSYVGGNPDGDVTVVEFLDYRCGYCRRSHGEVANLLSADGDIKFIIKEYPILGEDSTRSSQMALAVLKSFGDEAYERVHDALMTFSGPMNDATIKKIARETDVDADVILANMDTADVQNHISRVRVLGQEMQVTGTPTFIIGDQIVRGYVTADVMQQIVDDYRSRKN